MYNFEVTFTSKFSTFSFKSTIIAQTEQLTSQNTVDWYTSQLDQSIFRVNMLQLQWKYWNRYVNCSPLESTIWDSPKNVLYASASTENVFWYQMRQMLRRLMLIIYIYVRTNKLFFY